MFSLRTYLYDATWRNCSASSVLGASSISNKHNTSTSVPLMCVLFVLRTDMSICCLRLSYDTTATTVNSVHCCQWWLTVTVCEVVVMENMFLFRKNSNHRKVSGNATNPYYVKYPSSSPSLLTRLGLMQTSSPALSPPSSHLLRQGVVISVYMKFLQWHGIVAVHSNC